MNSKVKKMIDQSELVSFDIFDTLVSRMCKTPADVFTLVAQQYELPAEQFRADRIQAENAAREEDRSGEIRLEDIYRHLEQRYPNASELMQAEIAMEYRVCYPNGEMTALFQYACKNKTVVLTSDMYLSEPVIEKILENCRISGYRKLFLSSTLKKTKHAGDLFAHVLEACHKKPEQMLHIGDNLKSDYLIPKSKSIRAFRYVPPKKKLDSFCVPVLDAFLARKAPQEDSDFYHTFGYTVLGPAIYGYVSWIKDFLQKHDIQKVFFFAREGEFIKRAFDCIADQTFEGHYLYVSRRSLTVPAIATIHDVASFLKYRPIRDRVKVCDQIEKLGLKTADFSECSWCREETLQKTFGELQDAEKQAIIGSMFQKVQQQAKRELVLLKAYLRQEHVNQKFAVVDLGWNGSMQSALTDILSSSSEPFDMTGFFLAQRDEYYKYKDKIRNFGYLFNYGAVSPEENLLLNSGTSLLEFLFSASHGSTIQYAEKDGRICPVLDQYEFAEVYPIIRACQDGAIDFIHDFIGEFPDGAGIPCKQFFSPMYRVLQQPPQAVISHFGDICVSDMNETEIYLAEKCPVSAPKKWIRAFVNSGWKVAFLKRNLKTSHAMAMYSLLRKHFNG